MAATTAVDTGIRIFSTTLPSQSSTGENGAPKAVQSKSEIDTADNGGDQNLRPNNEKTRAAIEHILGKDHAGPAGDGGGA